MQTTQRIFNFTDIQVLLISKHNLESFDLWHAFLPVTVAKLSTPRKSKFLAHPVCVGTIQLTVSKTTVLRD